MSSKLMDNLDLYSDLISSVGTGREKRLLTPIECSDCIQRLQDETGESLDKLSTRLGLGKKRKIKTMNESPDTTQIKLFLKLQNLSRKSAYVLQFGKSTTEKVGFTIGCLVSDLPNERDQDIILQTVLKSAENPKPITKTDILHVLERKKKSPETPIEEIIEHVMNIKPVTQVTNMLVLQLHNSIQEKLNSVIRKFKKPPKEVMRYLINKKFINNEISSINIKNDNIYITIPDDKFKSLENNWKLNKTNVTDYFNTVLYEAMHNE